MIVAVNATGTYAIESETNVLKLVRICDGVCLKTYDSLWRISSVCFVQRHGVETILIVETQDYNYSKLRELDLALTTCRWLGFNGAMQALYTPASDEVLVLMWGGLSSFSLKYEDLRVGQATDRHRSKMGVAEIMALLPDNEHVMLYFPFWALMGIYSIRNMKTAISTVHLPKGVRLTTFACLKDGSIFACTTDSEGVLLDVPDTQTIAQSWKNVLACATYNGSRVIYRDGEGFKMYSCFEDTSRFAWISACL